MLIFTMTITKPGDGDGALHSAETPRLHPSSGGLPTSECGARRLKDSLAKTEEPITTWSCSVARRYASAINYTRAAQRCSNATTRASCTSCSPARKSHIEPTFDEIIRTGFAKATVLH